MSEVRIGYGEDLEHYKTISEEHTNLDISIYLDNGDYIEVCTRKKGYALRFKPSVTKKQVTLKDIDY